MRQNSKQPRVKTRGIAASGYARPTSSDNFIYGLTPVELRQNFKILIKFIFIIDPMVIYDYMVIFISAKSKKACKNRGRQRIAVTRKKKLKKAALDVFIVKGVEATTVEDITDKADLGKGILYRHYTDKEEVVFVLVVEDAIERLRSYPDEPETLKDGLEHFFKCPL